MNDQSNTEQTQVLAVTDVKHYAIELDAEGNEVRREITALEATGVPVESADVK